MTNRINREMVLLCAENALSMGLLDFGMAWLELAREIRLGTAEAAPVVGPPDHNPDKVFNEATSAADKLGRDAAEAADAYWATSLAESRAHWRRQWEAGDAARKQRDDERAPADTLARSTASAAVEAWGVYEDSLGTGSSDEQKRAWDAYVAASWAATRALRDLQKEGGK